MQLINSDIKTMSSREIAELTSKQHSKVCEPLKNLIDKGIAKMATLSPTKNHQTGVIYNEYLLDKRDSLVLVARLSPEFTAAVVDRWQELEQKAPALPDFNNPVEAARAWADAKESEQKALADLQQAKPAVEFVEKYVECSGNKGFREVCKLLKVKENKIPGIPF